MTRLLSALLVTSIVMATTTAAARADEGEAKAVIDKAIKATGGEEKLAKVNAYSTKSKSTFNFNGNDAEFEGSFTAQGLDHSRSEFGNDQFHGVIVLNGDKGWRKFGDNLTEIDQAGIERDKRMLYLQTCPWLLVPLKGKDFKLASAPDEKVDGKPAAVVKVTGPDGKDFTLSFDKESGLPVKLVAKVTGFNGEDFTQESIFTDYKDFGGIKKATKVEGKRDGEPFFKTTLTEFKTLDTVDPSTFAEPK
jgi:hypothetical protein